MAHLLLHSPLLFRYRRAHNEASNEGYSVNRESCLSFCGIPVPGQNASSRLDTALKALYRSVEMSPDSQLGQSPPDSQLEDVPSLVGDAHMRTPPHSTPPHPTPPHSTDMSAERRTPPTCGPARFVPPTSQEIHPPFSDESAIPAETLVYGYYLPARNLMIGNRGHTLTARFVWQRWFRHIIPQPLDGVAAWTDKTGVTTVRTVVRDFFTGKYMVFDRHPTSGKVWAPTNIV